MKIKNKEQITEKEANIEISKFHKQLLFNVIDVIKINQDELKKLLKVESRGKHLKSFHNGGIAFGDVLIHLLKEEIKKLTASEIKEIKPK